MAACQLTEQKQKKKTKKKTTFKVHTCKGFYLNMYKIIKPT